ncbi:uncharacterized protein MONBRDRAFT_34616 [Monosiga brevicollis MX1]|uniref:Pleckstrin homology domain-containing protein n=1 Tax=Monosiga brevicollis TaxID=81824 RepID=A9VCW5_MONBE|nr:uncharacterized protein MONBRDRAFT_34616 [Monosiga brevicollis MX1]EDQ84663.1 predicted protein [Monosiga brevicollis MX1]|eukprot:XP_001750567.1 hypothetical protein [Monosiga brevicollis MX1]
MYGAPVRQGLGHTRHGPLLPYMNEEGAATAASQNPDTVLPGTPDARAQVPHSTDSSSRSDEVRRLARAQRFDELLSRARSAVEKARSGQQDDSAEPSPRHTRTTKASDNLVTPFSPAEVEEDDDAAAQMANRPAPPTERKPLITGQDRSRPAPPIVAWHGDTEYHGEPGDRTSTGTTISALDNLTPRISRVVTVAPSPGAAQEGNHGEYADVSTPAHASGGPDILPAPTPFRGHDHVNVVRALARVLEDARDDHQLDDSAAQDTPLARQQGSVLSKLHVVNLDDETHEEIMLGNEADLNHASADQFSPETLVTEATAPLLAAAAHGNIALIKRLVDQGHDINGPDPSGRTPLMYAVHCNQLSVAELLVQMGALLDIKANDGSTALHRAAFSGTTEMVKLLIESGADHRVGDDDGRIALHWAAHNPRLGCMAQLLKRVRGDNAINQPDHAGMTAAIWACYYDRVHHLGKLKRAGADLGAADVDGKTCMHWAVQPNAVQCLAALAQQSSRLRLRDRIGRTALHYAAELDAKAAAKLLLRHDPTLVTEVDHRSRTALHYAAVCGGSRVLRVLLKHGASVNALDEDGLTPIDYARQRQHGACVALLASYGPHGRLSISEQQTGVTNGVSSADWLNSQGDQVSAIMQLFHLLTVGSHLEKFTNDGKGATHTRFFWVDMYTGEICWTKSPSSFVRNPDATSAAHVTAVYEGPSSNVTSRRDYEPQGKHRFGFSVATTDRVLDLIAPNEQLYRLWVEGLQCILTYGALQLASAQQDDA